MSTVLVTAGYRRGRCSSDTLVKVVVGVSRTCGALQIIYQIYKCRPRVDRGSSACGRGSAVPNMGVQARSAQPGAVIRRVTWFLSGFQVLSQACTAVVPT